MTLASRESLAGTSGRSEPFLTLLRVSAFDQIECRSRLQFTPTGPREYLFATGPLYKISGELGLAGCVRLPAPPMLQDNYAGGRNRVSLLVIQQFLFFMQQFNGASDDG